MQSGIPTESRRVSEKRWARQTDATGSIVRCDCWRGTSLFDTQSKHVWWTTTRGIGRTRKGHKFVFRIQNLDETHLKILRNTMRLIVLMVFVYLDTKGCFSTDSLTFLSWNTNGEVLSNGNAALFCSMEVDGEDQLHKVEKTPQSIIKVVHANCKLYSNIFKPFNSFVWRALFTENHLFII